MIEEGHSPHEAEELERKALERAHELRRVIDFGIQVQALLETPVVRRIIEDCDTERMALMEESVRVDVSTAEGERRHNVIRQRVAVIDLWQTCFARYITEGHDAEAAFIEGELTGE